MYTPAETRMIAKRYALHVNYLEIFMQFNYFNI